MKIRISKAQIVDERHPDNGKKRDILIENGKITKIAATISTPADRVIEGPGLCVSIGWMDMRANFRDPGDEQKEDLESGLKAAAHGGFTAVAHMPSTSPAVDNKGAVEYLLNRSRTNKVEVVPIGAVSKKLAGESLAEMYDMHLAGAKAFSDDKKSLAESGMLHRALLYTKNFDATVIHFPYDSTLIPNGQINEGVQSTELGLKGIPAIAEEMMVDRDLTLLNYTEGKLHLGPLSSAASVKRIASAKKDGLSITCETTAAHLAYSEEVLDGFDSNYKLLPPLRSEQNRKELIKLLKAGKIDVISSDHSPEDEEHKKLEFDYANFGAAGIETFFPLLYNAVGETMELDKLIATFSINPRRILGMPIPEIKEGVKANLTLFSTVQKTSFSRKDLKTKAYNVAEVGREMNGKVLETISPGR